ncbi:hypothetical protein [Lacticaseibacillus thailandensis]|uniref:Uncharacterized protein n=1 Tax=Lacticaseibacillus thailandensis DSM 22698 = JCM 13996 TaxID=1423810 RepID=A0A0R2CJ76_9LACO|nr:hypothetical protein [Lacticaseibacillus thailandensis]KRM87763.1 hypothetical protein FD19_GL000038 [Lacticaseibacillus thailandensis DSM 22698 = JCM 13996]
MPIIGCLAAIIIFVVVAAILSLFASVAWFLVEFIGLPLLVIVLIVWLITSISGGHRHGGGPRGGGNWRDDYYDKAPRREVHNLNDDDH